ncbi:MAG: hypothetical protein WC364_00660 [Eubacteriales bacterium]
MNIPGGWRIYNRALLPSTPPHEEPNIAALYNSNKWYNMGVVLARYTTDFDCGYETEWWWLIKDNPVDISALNANRRYKIKKGLKSCVIRKFSLRCMQNNFILYIQLLFRTIKRPAKLPVKRVSLRNAITMKTIHI